MVQWLRAQEPPCEWDEGSCSHAARGGHLEVYILYTIYYILHSLTIFSYSILLLYTLTIYSNAILLQLLQWMRAQDPPCPWSEEDIVSYAMSGRAAAVMDVVRWLLFETECEYNEEVLMHLAGRGERDLIVWLREQDPPCEWDSRACSMAATQRWCIGYDISHMTYILSFIHILHFIY
jgi:hypothetical protein